MKNIGLVMFVIRLQFIRAVPGRSQGRKKCKLTNQKKEETADSMDAKPYKEPEKQRQS